MELVLKYWFSLVHLYFRLSEDNMNYVVELKFLCQAGDFSAHVVPPCAQTGKIHMQLVLCYSMCSVSKFGFVYSIYGGSISMSR